MNAIELVGRAVDVPVIKYFDNGRHVARFRLAVDRGQRKPGTEDEWLTDFFTVELFSGKPTGDFSTLAERMVEQIHKGALVGVKGALHIDEFTDSDGVKRKSPKVDATWFKVYQKKEQDGDGQAARAGRSAPPPADLDSEIDF